MTWKQTLRGMLFSLGGGTNLQRRFSPAMVVVMVATAVVVMVATAVVEVVVMAAAGDRVPTSLGPPSGRQIRKGQCRREYPTKQTCAGNDVTHHSLSARWHALRALVGHTAQQLSNNSDAKERNFDVNFCEQEDKALPW
jgi:hypothetical protein